MPAGFLSRRRLLGAAALPFLGACGTPLPLGPAPASAAAATARLRESAEAHGLAAYRQITDINIAYAGQWRPLINGVQPVVVDAGFRGPSQERLMPAQGRNAQAYTGPRGSKQVSWRRGGGATPAEVGVWFNGSASSVRAVLDAAAVVADCYGLFLLGPLWLLDRAAALQADGTERVDGRLCDVVQAWLSPGFGFSAQDRVSLCIDRDGSVTRRMRFTLEGYAGTQGAVAMVDCFEHERRFGVLWPMRSYEEVLHPLRLPAHDWRITGLDVNRGYAASAIEGAAFTGAAAAPATPI